MAEQTAHDAAMAARVDTATAATNAAVNSPIGSTPAAPAAAPTAAQRPENVPEKFWDAATGQVNTTALLASYTELERLKAAPAAATTTPPAGADPAQAAITAAKLDTATLSQEWVTTGSLSEASYKALETAGFGKDIVDAHIAGQVALANQRDSKGFELAGGKDSFEKMAAWAASSLNAADIAVLNQGLAGNEAQMAQAVIALKARYEGQFGKEPQLTSGGNQVTDPGEKPFASRAEVTAAMRDPKYRSDPAYRAVVERRIGAMPVF